MLSNPAAILSLRTWRRRAIVTAVAVGVALGVRQVRDAPPARTLVEACRAQSEAEQAAGRAPPWAPCLAAFVGSGDPATGARAARGLAGHADMRWVVEWIADRIGDSDAGADAWLAAGRVRRSHDDLAGAVAAYQRALRHRATDNLAGRLRDENGLLIAYQLLGDHERALLAAARAYALAAGMPATRERRVTLVSVARLLLEVGNLETTRRLLEEANAITPTTDPIHAAVQELLGLVEQRRGHPRAARRALLAARDAQRAHGQPEWPVYLNLLDLALEQGDLAEVDALARHAPPAMQGEQDRAIDAYYQAQIRIAQGRFREAAQIVVQAQAQASSAGRCTHLLDATLGHALRRAGAVSEAEPPLRRAVQCIEDQRSAIDNDTLKSWLLAQQRAPFEDLFLLHAEQGKPLDALMTVQRATARSVLDGVLAAPIAADTVLAEIARAGVRADALRSIARSLRVSPSAAAPPIAGVLQRLRAHHVVTYFRARQELWAIAIQRDSTVVTRRIGDVGEIARAVAQWRAEPERADLAEQLGIWLLPDALIPRSGETLYLVPDDPVREVTFASLRRHGAYVIERNPLAYELSAASLSIAPRAAGTGPALVIGDPLGDLPGARQEVHEVASLLGTVPRLGVAATRAAVRAAANAWLLHVAAHTDAAANGPAIHLADGPLDAASVLEWPLAPRMVVLLGCSSARARDRDELAPLTAAFIAAGSHTVVASMWAVDDEIAHRFAREFYRAGGTRNPIEALAQAQRELMRRGAPVTQWSTFVVVGGLRDHEQGDR